jgi:hypothetical protein
MAYLGKGPSDTFSGVTSKDSFTGDGSTVNFDISTDIPQGGDTDIFVYVDNVRQEPGVSKAYTTGQDGNGKYRRITFTTAPDSGAEIYILNPGRIEALQEVSDNSVSTAKIQSSAVTTAKINDGAVTTAKLGSAAVTNTNLDTSIITGFTELAEEAASGDFLIIYDTSTGTLKKIQRSNIVLQVPTISSVTPTNIAEADSSLTTTFTITGTGFSTGVSVILISEGGSEISFDTVTRNSITELTCVLSNHLITSSIDEPYDVKVTNSSGLSATLSNQISVNQLPIWITASGSLGTQRVGTFTSTVEAIDPESAGAVVYELIDGVLPTGITLNESTGVISGTITPETSDTTYNFTLRAKDVASHTTTRSFSITLQGPQITSFTSSGTFSVPSGITAVDVLVVGGGGSGGCQHGGGGGAGGLIYRPGFPVTPGGTVTVTVGDGGISNSANTSRPTPSMPSYTGQDSVFGTLTAKGGGYGSKGPEQGPVAGGQGGSGGGGGYEATSATAGQGTQPTQPGDSGTYGFGNSGGAISTHPTNKSGGGGGGAGAVGTGGQNNACGQTGGIGRTYTIADGTTPVYYAGGGGGGGHAPLGGTGGQGGGGTGGGYVGPSSVAGNFGQPGTANRGGGGGGNGRGIAQAAGPLNVISSGGKGIVIVKY